MAAPKFLAPGEQVVFHVRAHWKRLIAPVVALLVIGALVWLALVELVPDPQTQAVWRWVIGIVGIVLVLVFSVWPFLSWLSTTDTLTTKRLISRDGVITRTGRDIPIERVNAVTYERQLIDRIFGCGTLIVQTAGTDSDVELHDVAHIERRLIQIQQILVDEQAEEDRRVRAIVAEEQRRTSDRVGSDGAASSSSRPGSADARPAHAGADAVGGTADPESSTASPGDARTGAAAAPTVPSADATPDEGSARGPAAD